MGLTIVGGKDYPDGIHPEHGMNMNIPRNPDERIRPDFGIRFELEFGVTFEKNANEDFGTIEVRNSSGNIVKSFRIEIKIEEEGSHTYHTIRLPWEGHEGRKNYSSGGNSLTSREFIDFIKKLYSDNANIPGDTSIPEKIAAIF